MLRQVLKEVFKKWQPKFNVNNSNSKPMAISLVDEADDGLYFWRERYKTISTSEKLIFLVDFQTWVSKNISQKAWIQLGDWFLDASQYQQAEDAYRNALKIDARSPRAHEGLGLTMLAKHEIAQAIRHFEISDQFSPQNSSNLNHWGMALLEHGNFIEAGKHFERAIDADHNNFHAWHNMGLVAVIQGRAKTGISHFRRSLSINPNFGLAYSNLALTLRDTEQLTPALDAAQKAIDLKKNNARVWVIGADIATDAGLFELAQLRIQQAILLDDHHVGVHIAAAKLFTQLTDYKMARCHFDLALEIDPGNAEAQGGKGQLALLLGEWDTGWHYYEARRRTQPPSIRQFGLEDWDGCFTPNQHLLVYAEQGLGDTILFASCLPQLVRDAQNIGAKITLETPMRLARLFQLSFPTIEVIGREPTASDVDWLHPLQCTHECPIGSLPIWYRCDAKEFVFHQGYLKTDEMRIAYWQSVLHNYFGNRRLIGLTWKGGLLRSASVQRSISLVDMLSSLGLGHDVGFVILQHGDIAIELDQLPPNWKQRCWYESGALADMCEAAALTHALDMVVTVCNTQAHLTGALGREGIVLVPKNPNWRYGIESDRTPWYPSLHLVRQAQFGQWDDCLNAARSWLDTRFSQQSVL